MRSTTRRNLAAAAVIAVIIAAALVCTAAGTLTAFSARYTWQSDEGMSGSFPFEDTEYTLALFDGAAGFLPGDGGSALLEGPSFAGYTPIWSFSENNPSGIPVVYFVKDESGEIVSDSVYSAYDFSPLNGTYAACDDGTRIAVAGISRESADLAAALAVGRTLAWMWPSAFYESETAETPLDTPAVDAYDADCLEFCTFYAFPDALEELFADGVVGVVTGYAEGSATTLVWTAEDRNNSLIVGADGSVTACGTNAPVYSGGKFDSSPDFDYTRLTGAEEIWLFVVESKAAGLEERAGELGLGDIVSLAGAYAFNAENNNAVPDEGGSRWLVKLSPAATAGSGHPVSVTVTATVTAA